MRRFAIAAGALAMSTLAFADTPTLSPDPEQGAFVAHYLVKKKPGMSFDAFRSYEIETHAPMALALPGLQAYRLTFFPPSQDGAQTYDAMATLTFESRAAHDAALASEEGQRALADLPNVVDPAAMLLLATGAAEMFVGDLAAD
jgi:uncharacterized protein (TIGR02118 family)